MRIRGRLFWPSLIAAFGCGALVVWLAGRGGSGPPPRASAPRTDAADTAAQAAPSGSDAGDAPDSWASWKTAQPEPGDCRTTGAVWIAADVVPTDVRVGRAVLSPSPDAAPTWLGEPVAAGPDGTFALPPVAPQPHMVVAAWSAAHRTAAAVADPCGPTAVLLPRDGAALTVRLSDETAADQPWSVAVSSSDAQWRATVGATPAVTIHNLPPGPLHLAVSAGVGGYDAEDPIDLRPGEQVDVPVRLEPTAAVPVTAKNGAHGLYAAWRRGPGHPVWTARLDAPEALRVPAPFPGEVWVGSFSHTPAYHPLAQESAPVAVGTAGPPGRISGTVTTPRGAPLPGALVRAVPLQPVFGVTHAMAPLLPLSEGHVVAVDLRPPLAMWHSARTAEDGTFALAIPWNGPVRLIAAHPDYAEKSSAPVFAAPGAAVGDVHLVLRKGVRARITARDAQGAPLSGALVRVSPPDGPPRAYACDEGGTATTPAFPPGFDLEVLRAGFATARRHVLGRPGETVRWSVTLQRADAVLEGRVVPAAVVQLRAELVRDHAVFSVRGRSRPDGTFTLGPVVAGRYRITALCGDTPCGSAESESGNAAQVRIALPQSPVPAGTPHTGNGVPELREPAAIPTWENRSGSSAATATAAPSTATAPPPSGRAGSLPITVRWRKGKVVITGVSRGSQVDMVGIRAGDVLRAVDGKVVRSPAHAQRLLRGPAGSVVMLEVVQDGVPFTAVVQRSAEP